MVRKYSLLLSGLGAIIALATIILMLTGPSWSSPAQIFVSNPAPEYLPAAPGVKFTLNGGGFSSATNLWLVPERSIRSATTASMETFGNPYQFARRDDFLYVANGVGGFSIFTGLQSPVPSIVGVLNSEGQGMEIALRKDEALMAAGMSGLQIIDIRDTTKPQLLAVLKGVAPAISVASKGDIAYVAAGKSGVQIVDLSDPHNPRHTLHLNPHVDAYKVICTEKLLIISTGTNGLIYDITLPDAPRFLAKLPVAGGMNSVMTQHGEILYWATKTKEKSCLYAVDLSQPATPLLIKSARFSDTPYGISYNDNRIAIATSSGGTKLFFAPNKETLLPMPTVSAQNKTTFSLPLGDDLWVADGSGVLLRLNQQVAMALNDSPILPDFSQRIAPIVTPHLFLLGDDDGLSIYDRMDDQTPILLGQLKIKGLSQQYLSTEDNRLWLITRISPPLSQEMLLSVDLSVPHSPRIIAKIELPAPSVIVGESGKLLVVASQNTEDSARYIYSSWLNYDKLETLHFIDTSLRESPLLLPSYSPGGANAGVGLFDNTLVLMQRDGIFRILDITVPQEPKELGSLQMPWLQASAWEVGVSIVIKDQVAFISSHLAEIIVIDLHDPRHPKQLGTMSLPGPVNSLLTFDHFLFAGTGKTGLAVIDLKNPLKAEFLGILPLPGSQQRYCVQSGRLWYMNPNTQGLWSLPLPRRLQSSVTGPDEIDAGFEHTPSPGAYRLWLTDPQNHLLVPGVTWVGTQIPTR